MSFDFFFRRIKRFDNVFEWIELFAGCVAAHSAHPVRTSILILDHIFFSIIKFKYNRGLEISHSTILKIFETNVSHFTKLL